MFPILQQVTKAALLNLPEILKEALIYGHRKSLGSNCRQAWHRLRREPEVEYILEPVALAPACQPILLYCNFHLEADSFLNLGELRLLQIPIKA